MCLCNTSTVLSIVKTYYIPRLAWLAEAVKTDRTCYRQMSGVELCENSRITFVSRCHTSSLSSCSVASMQHSTKHRWTPRYWPYRKSGTLLLLEDSGSPHRQPCSEGLNYFTLTSHSHVAHRTAIDSEPRESTPAPAPKVRATGSSITFYGSLPPTSQEHRRHHRDTVQVSPGLGPVLTPDLEENTYSSLAVPAESRRLSTSPYSTSLRHQISQTKNAAKATAARNAFGAGCTTCEFWTSKRHHIAPQA